MVLQTVFKSIILEEKSVFKWERVTLPLPSLTLPPSLSDALEKFNLINRKRDCVCDKERGRERNEKDGRMILPLLNPCVIHSYTFHFSLRFGLKRGIRSHSLSLSFFFLSSSLFSLTSFCPIFLSFYSLKSFFQLFFFHPSMNLVRKRCTFQISMG